MATNYDLVAVHTAGASGAQVDVIHGDFVQLNPPPALSLAVQGSVTLSPTRYYGKPRNHHKPSPKKRLRTTLAGSISIPEGSTVVINSQRKSGNQDPFPVLTAKVEKNYLRVVMVELSNSRKHDQRKASVTRLRRNARESEPIFYVWSKDKIRLTIKQKA